MSNVTFNFLSQCYSVDVLLKACVEALPFIPESQNETLVKALRDFEESGAVTLWSVSDVDDEDEHGLTESEKRDAISRFIDDGKCTETDWMNIEYHRNAVLAERELHLCVKYDPLYTGGSYEGTAQTVYIPLSLIQEFEKEQLGDDCVEFAFTKTTKMDSMHIVEYDLNVHYNQYHEPIEAIPVDD